MRTTFPDFMKNKWWIKLNVIVFLYMYLIQIDTSKAVMYSSMQTATKEFLVYDKW